MKLLTPIILFCIAVLCVNAYEPVDVNSQDVLDVDFYGLDAAESIDAPSEESETDEVENDEAAMIDATTLRPFRRSGSEHRHGRHGHRHNERRHGRHQRRTHWGGNWTSEEKLNHLCNKLSNANEDWMSKFQHMFARMSDEQKTRMREMMIARQSSMSLCCQLTSNNERQQCVDTLRQQRYDRVCNGQEPLCIFAEIMGTSSQSTATVDRCCALTGQERSTCFTEARSQPHRGSRRVNDRRQRGSGPSQ